MELEQTHAINFKDKARKEMRNEKNRSEESKRRRRGKKEIFFMPNDDRRVS